MTLSRTMAADTAISAVGAISEAVMWVGRVAPERMAPAAIETLSRSNRSVPFLDTTSGPLAARSAMSTKLLRPYRHDRAAMA